MDILTVSLFGHREIDDLRRVGDQLAPIIKELIQAKPYVSFCIAWDLLPKIDFAFTKQQHAARGSRSFSHFGGVSISKNI